MITSLGFGSRMKMAIALATALVGLSPGSAGEPHPPKAKNTKPAKPTDKGTGAKRPPQPNHKVEKPPATNPGPAPKPKSGLIPSPSSKGKAPSAATPNVATTVAKSNPAADHAKKLANNNVKLSEAETLKNAYILLAMANHDYGGHRVAAMRHVESAIRTLDESVKRNGTAQQRAIATTQEIAAARAKFIAANTPALHENQVISDLQLREASRLISAVWGPANGLKQPKVLAHLQRAASEVNIALQIR